MPSNQDPEFGRQERWSNLQFVVVTIREYWPVFMLGALSFLFRWGKGGGARAGGKQAQALTSFLHLNRRLVLRHP